MTKEEKVRLLSATYESIRALEGVEGGRLIYEGKYEVQFKLHGLDHEKAKTLIIEELKKECEKIEKELKEIF